MKIKEITSNDNNTYSGENATKISEMPTKEKAVLLSTNSENYDAIIQELNQYIDTEVTDEILQETILYNELQGANKFELHPMGDLSEIQLLIAKIVALSPTLHSACLPVFFPEERIVDVAQELAKSNLHFLDISHNNLGKNGPSVAAALAQSNSLHTLYIGFNNLGENGPSVAAALTESNSIRFLGIANNNLGPYEESVLKILNSHNHTIRETQIRVIDNNLIYSYFLPEEFAYIVGEYIGHENLLLPFLPSEVTGIVGDYLDNYIDFNIG